MRADRLHAKYFSLKYVPLIIAAIALMGIFLSGFDQRKFVDDDENKRLLFMKEMYLWENVSSSDYNLIKWIRKFFVVEPSSRSTPYQLNKPKQFDRSQIGQAGFILNMLNNMTNGFFVECGAHDGELFSNTIYMERLLNWSGILIEASRKGFKELVAKNRKSWLSNTCLSLTPNPTKVTFRDAGVIGGIEVHGGRPIQVQCLPLYSLLLAVNRTEVDYFSLDVEGSELKILKTIPWNLVQIKTISVEIAHTIEGKKRVLKYMEDQGYILYKIIKNKLNVDHDYILYHPRHLGKELFVRE